MNEYARILERARAQLPPPALTYEQLLLRRDRSRRNQRVAAGVVGGTVFVVAFAILLLVFNRTTPPRPAEPIPAPTTAPTKDPATPDSIKGFNPGDEQGVVRRNDGLDVGTITMTASGCALDLTIRSIDVPYVELGFLNDSEGRAWIHMGRLERGHTFAELASFVERADRMRREGVAAAFVPHYFHPAVGYITVGNLSGYTPRFKVDTWETGTWSGPFGRPNPSDTLAVICVSRLGTPGEPRRAFVAGPIEIR